LFQERVEDRRADHGPSKTRAQRIAIDFQRRERFAVERLRHAPSGSTRRSTIACSTAGFAPMPTWLARTSIVLRCADRFLHALQRQATTPSRCAAVDRGGRHRWRLPQRALLFYARVSPSGR
jgi:hypothetical protein